MNTWIIEPRDPLIVRDGRPFGPTPGARAESLMFPFPSTSTGGVRTRDGLNDEGRFRVSEIPRVKKIAVHGPLLVELDSATSDILHWFAPAPADALLLEIDTPDSSNANLMRLVPLDMRPQDSTNLPTDLSLVGMTKPYSGKPIDQSPRYWNWKRFEKWLLNPQEEELRLGDLGSSGPVKEKRIHVSIDTATQTAIEHVLFLTKGLEFTQEGNRSRMALAIATEASNLKTGIAPLGGERRLVHWRPSSQSFPSCPSKLRTSITTTRHCRVILITPACFQSGSTPSWLENRREGVTSKIRAMAVTRHQVVSGWDFEWFDKKNKKYGCPKRTRRLAPAGTVLFLKLDGDDEAIEKWIEATWMKCMSDDEQDRRDGFGLSVLGIWDGTFQPMEV